MKLRSVGLSLPLRRIGYASRIPFARHGRCDHGFYLRLRRSWPRGSGGLPPVKNNVSEAGCATGLWDAKQWSGTAERSETAEGRENHNHRSFKPTQSGCVFLLKNSKNRLFRLALGVTFSGLGCRQGRKRAPKGRQTIYPRAPRFNRGAIFSPSRASSLASRTSAAVCAAVCAAEVLPIRRSGCVTN